MLGRRGVELNKFAMKFFNRSHKKEDKGVTNCQAEEEWKGMELQFSAGALPLSSVTPLGGALHLMTLYGNHLAVLHDFSTIIGSTMASRRGLVNEPIACLK